MCAAKNEDESGTIYGKQNRSRANGDGEEIRPV